MWREIRGLAGSYSLAILKRRDWRLWLIHCLAGRMKPERKMEKIEEKHWMVEMSDILETSAHSPWWFYSAIADRWKCWLLFRRLLAFGSSRNHNQDFDLLMRQREKKIIKIPIFIFNFHKVPTLSQSSLPVTLSRISLHDSTSPMLPKSDLTSSCVIVCGR